MLTGSSASSLCWHVDGTLPVGQDTDDGAGLLCRGTTVVEALVERADARTFHVEADGRGDATETPLPPRLPR